MRKYILTLSAIFFTYFISLATQLNGTYTINPAATATSTNFKNVASALLYMNGGARTDGGPNNVSPFGVSGPVIFNISPGNYPESITVGTTTGASATNTITLQKLPAAVGEVIFNTSVTSGLSIFNMNTQNGKYYSFKSLRFQPTVTSTATTVSSMINNCIYLSIDNCIFDHANVATSNIQDIYLCNEVTVTNSTFYNSLSTAKYQGVCLGSSFYITFTNNTVKNTAFNSSSVRAVNSNTFQQSAISIGGDITAAASFSDNILNNATLNILTVYSNLNLNIERNKINIDRQYYPDVFTNASDAIGNCISFNAAGTSGSTVKLANNFISINQNVLPTGTAGINLGGGQPYTVQVYHNTISVNSTQQTVLPISNGAGAVIKNNIFSHSSNGLAANSGGLGTWDYNNYYSAATPSYIANDAHPKTEKVNFVSTTDLHHSSGCLKGTALGILTDIDGAAKNATSPVIGATEATSISLDGAITRIVAPGTLYLQGPTLQTISFKLVNKGTNNITSAEANYTINNGAPTSETFTGLNIAACDSATLSFTGQYNFPADRTILKITLTQVNGSADPNTANDFIQSNVDILGPMSGTYTVNPAAASTPFNFQRIGEADTAMMTRSIVGPVTIAIYNGTYTQSNRVLNTVPGVSSTNTIKFTSFSNDSLQVIITDSFVIRNVPYVTLEKLKFAGSNVYTAAGIIQVFGTSNNFTIKNCNISGRIDYKGGNNFNFANNYLAGGVQISNNGGLPTMSGLLLKNNVITGGSADANNSPFILQCFNVAKPVLDGNTFQDFNFNHVSGSFAYKSTFYFVGCSDTLFIKYNKFLRCGTTRLVGDFDTNPIVTTKLAHVEMFNNFITATGQFRIGTSDLSAGVGVTQSMRYYFNNFYNISTSTGTTGFSFGSIGSTSFENGVSLCKNNIFASKYTAIPYIRSAAYPANSDNNSFFTNGPTLVTAGVTNYANLAAYKAAGFEPNSISVNPKYIDSSNLHVQHPSLLGAGVPAPAPNPLLFDIDNDNRNALNPAIGADEPLLPSNDVIAKQIIAAKVNFAANTAQPLSLKILNNGSAILNQVKVHWSIDGTEQLPAYTWSGNLAYDSSTNVNFGSYTFPMMKYTSLKVWTDLPNASPDMVPVNDTLRLDSIMPFARGNFTVGGASPSVPGFFKAAEYLTYAGVDSAVNILVRNGKYIEQPIIKFIKGASLTNLVTFKGENNSASLDTLAFSATGIGAYPLNVVTLDSAAFVNFKHITFQSTNPGNGYVTEILMRNKVRFVNIDSCVFHSVSAASSTLYAHILQQSLSTIDSNINITNSRFSSGIGGIIMTLNNGIIKGNRFEAMGNGAQAMDITVAANSYGIIDSNFVQNPVICTFPSGNNCLSFGVNGINGIKLNAATGSNADITVSRNKIYASGNAALFSQSNGNVSKPIKIYNNFFSGRSSYVVFAGGQYNDFYNNTIADSSSNSNNSLVNISNSNINFKNNIVAKTISVPDLSYRILDFSNSFFVSTFNSSNNAYYIADTTKTVYNGSVNLSLSAWKALGKDANSRKITPAFYNYFGDLHIDKNKAGAVDVFKFAIPLTVIPKDIDDSTRSLTTPSIGADEFSLNDNDGGAIAITNLTVQVNNGINNIITSIRNYGNNNITAATINWSVNNVLQSPYAWAGNIATGDSATNINIGNFNFTGVNKYDIKIWTSIAGDVNPINDTAFKSVYPALCGSYSISGIAPDFINVASAANYASFAGVSCPVVFNIRDGVYNESDTINFIPGTSAINTVTFQSQSLDSSKVIFTQSASFIGTNPYSVLKINGAQYIKLKSLGIKRIADPLYNFYFDVVLCSGNVSGLEITNCDISSSGSGKLIDASAFSVPATPNTDMVFNQNNFSGGATGVLIGAASTSTFAKAVTISNNKFNRTIGSGSNTYTIDIGGTIAANVSNNFIDSTVTNRYVGGIRLWYTNGKINVLGNTIIKRKGINGIYLEALRGGTFLDSSAIVANNFITIDSSLAAVGILGQGIGRNVKIVYNNILNNSTSASSRAMQFSNSYSGSTGVLKDSIANNNIVSTSAGYGLYFQQNTAGDVQCYNNNIFVSGSAILTNYNGTNYTTIPTFQTAGGTFVNNVSKSPLYISATDLHVLELTLRTNGTPLPYVLKDIDNDTRGLVNTTIGADEIVVNNLDMGVSALVTPVKPFAAGNQNITVSLKNYGATTITNATVNWSINGITQTPFNYTGSLAFGNTANAIISNYNFVVDSAYNLKFWTSNPNGSTDNNLTNDSTIVADFYPALSGTYTLGGITPDFKSFVRSAANLKNGGMLGNVIFNVRDGKYNEAMRVDSIPFQNNFTATWQSESGDSSNVILAYSPTLNDNVFGVLQFDKAKNIFIKKMTIQAKLPLNNLYTSPSFRSIIYFSTKNKNIQLISNRIIDSTFYTFPYDNITGTRFIYNRDEAASTNGNFYRSYDSSIVIDKNYFKQTNTSGNPIIDLSGVVQYNFNGTVIIFSNYLNNCTISNNQFDLQDISKQTLLVDNIDSLRLISNKITGRSVLSGKDYLIIDKNDFYHEGNAKVAVTVAAGTGRAVNKPCIISNNMIQTKVVGTFNGANVNNSGITITGDRVNFIHNSVAASDTGYLSGFDSYAALNITGNADTIKNNIFYNLNGGYLLYTTCTNLVSNNNDYVYSNHFSNNANTLAQYRIVTGQDATSVQNINPYFRGPKDLHASNIFLKVAPTVVPSNNFYTSDIDGQNRTGTVCIGADEFLQPVNDLVITEVLPAKVFGEGINDVKIRVYNNGSNPITSFNSLVQLTNYPAGAGGVHNPVNAGSLNYNFTGNIASGTSQLITLGQLNIPLYRNQFKINCSNTNGVADEVPFTDSIQNDNFYAGLNGIYTFDNSYPLLSSGVSINSFDEVGKQLRYGGVFSPSTLNLKAGIHFGELRIDSVPNRGSLSPLVIQSADADSANTGISNGIYNYASAITMFNANHITIKKLNLFNTVANAMVLGFNSQYIAVENCKIKGGDALRAIPGSPITGYGIYASGNWAGMSKYNDSNYIFKNNYFDGGGSALSVNGGSLGITMRNLLIDSNTFINTKGDAINTVLAKNVLITNNVIETNSTEPTFRGIFSGSSIGYTSILKNKVYAQTDAVGISMDDYYGAPYQLTDSIKIMNNFISVGGNNIATRGLFLDLKYKPSKIYHNSIYNRNTNAQSIAYDFNNNNSLVKTEVINNIFHNQYNGIPVSIYKNINTGSNYEEHHNQLFTNGGVYGIVKNYINFSTVNTNTYPTLAALAATGIDYSSVSGDPLFVSDKDLHVDGSNVNNAGDYTYTPQAPTDIDNEARSFSTPDIGADEFFLPDYGVVQLESPQSSCSHTATETVKVYMKNFGQTPRNKIPVAYRINGGSIVRDTANILLNAGDSALFTFTQTANLSSPINYSFELWSDYRGDSLRSNDTLLTLVTTTPANNVLPYYTGFEGTNAGWYTGGQNTSFKWGVIFSGIIDSAANGLNAWKTNLTGPHKNNELSYLYSPCFDMSAVSGDPVLNFNFSHQLENNIDKAWLEISSDAGITWTKVGAQGEGLKWYNNAGNYWTGLDNQWHNVKHSLPISALANKTQVRIRFVMQTNGTVVQDGIAIDDISIYTGANPPVSNGTYTNRTAISTGTGTFIPINDPSGNRLVEINDAGQTLGNITVDVNQTIGGVPTTYNGQNYLGRSFVIHAQNQPATPVTVRLFITQAEVDAWKALDPTIDIMRNISVQKYSSNVLEDFDITNNTSGTTLNISPAQLTKLPYQDGYIIEFQVSNFSEFWLTKGGPAPTSCLGNNITFNATTTGSTYQWQVNTGAGYSNISDNANYSGTGTATLQINGIPTSTSGYKYRCVVDAVNGPDNILRFVLTWTGAVSNAWELPGNWSCSTIPDEFTDVVIPTGLTNYPLVNTSTSVRKIDVQSGTTLNVMSGVLLEIKGK